MSQREPQKRRRENADAQCLKRIAATYEDLKEIEKSKFELIEVNNQLHLSQIPS